MACCAVGGQNPSKNGSGTRAQSPRAQILVKPSTDKVLFTVIFPALDFGSCRLSMSGCGELGTVETSVLVGMTSPLAKMAFSLVAASRRVFRQSSTPRFCNIF